MTFYGIIMETEESGQQDITLHRCAGRSMGSEPEAVQVPRGCVPASSRMAATGRINPGAGMSQDGRRHSTKLNLEIGNLRAGRRILGL
jgi:hypothetical protein